MIQLILIVFAFGLGYALGRRVGREQGRQLGLVQAIIDLRIDALEQAICPLCRYKPEAVKSVKDFV